MPDLEKLAKAYEDNKEPYYAVEDDGILLCVTKLLCDIQAVVHDFIMNFGNCEDLLVYEVYYTSSGEADIHPVTV